MALLVTLFGYISIISYLYGGALYKKKQKDVSSKVNIRNLVDITVKKVLNLSNFGKKLSTFVGSEGLRWCTLCKNRCTVDKMWIN